MTPTHRILLLAAVVSGPIVAAPRDVLVAQAASCSTAMHGAFDFWIGDWNVVDSSTGRVAGHNRIERVDGGCVVRERYMTAGAYSGQSLNWYDPTTQRWHQLWLDSGGLILRLAGGPAAEGTMVLEGVGRDSAGTTVERITWTRRADGSVRQHWTQARTAAGPWQTVFDGIYARRAP